MKALRQYAKRPGRKGLNDGYWQKYFLPQIYGALNPDLENKDADEQHFKSKGFKELRQFQSNGKFDVQFYRSFHKDIAEFSAEDAYKHYLIHGLEEGRLASLDDVLAFHGFTGPLPPHFAVNDDPTGLESIRRFEVFIAFNPDKMRDYLASSDILNLDLLQTGSFSASKGDQRRAIICVEHCAC